MRRLAIAVAGLLLLAPLAWIGLEPRLFRNWHTPLRGTPADVGLVFEPVAFSPSDQPITLRAWWLPAPGARAALVMVHGGGDNKSHPYTKWLELARALVGHGYAIMDLDVRNHGESDDSTSRQPTAGEDEAYDVIAALDYLERRAPGLRTGALGYSMGGQAVLYATARDPRLAAVMEDATYAELRTIFPRFASAASGLPILLFSDPFLSIGERLRGQPTDRGHAVDVIASIAPRPALLIHDEADPIVPVEHCRRLARAYPAAETWITSGADAGFLRAQGPWGTHAQSFQLHRTEYVARVTRFFDDVFVR